MKKKTLGNWCVTRSTDGITRWSNSVMNKCGSTEMTKKCLGGRGETRMLIGWKLRVISRELGSWLKWLTRSTMTRSHSSSCCLRCRHLCRHHSLEWHLRNLKAAVSVTKGSPCHQPQSHHLTSKSQCPNHQSSMNFFIPKPTLNKLPPEHKKVLRQMKNDML